jgi:hypothetical protein
LLPELDESNNLLTLLVLSQLSVGIAEKPLLGILGQEGQNPFLPAAPLADIVLFHQGVLAVKGNGVEVQIKRTAPRKTQSPDSIKPKPHQPWIRSRINPTAIFSEKRPFGNHVEPSKQSQPLVQDIAHDVAVPSTPKQFEPQKRTYRLPSRNHLCPREPCLFEHLFQTDLSQIRDKQIQPPELGSESPRRKIEPVHIGNLCELGPRPWESFLVSPSRQPRKTFLLENQRDSNGAYPTPALLQDPADIIDGEILFSQCDDLVPDTVGFGRNLRPPLRGKEKRAIRMLTELVSKDPEASRRIPKAAGDFC